MYRSFLAVALVLGTIFWCCWQVPSVRNLKSTGLQLSVRRLGEFPVLALAPSSGSGIARLVAFIGDRK